MCGIAGIVDWGGGAAPLDDVRAMVSTLGHRGPDAVGFHGGGGAAIGMARLSIIDLETGDQPIANEAGDRWIVANGEIYNFPALRARLEAAGHVFRTRSDVECALHAFEEWGARAVHELRGMFALAIWDETARRLTLARDRVGEKPLYYAQANGRLWFASEIKAFPESIRGPMDLAALDDYLAYGYIGAPRTIYRDVRKLPPGHMLVADRGGVRVERYFGARAAPSGITRLDEALEALRPLLLDAVRSQMLADVPLGAFLSGGLDSSTIVALMARAGGTVRTFTVGFEEADHDERADARFLAGRLGTRHEEDVVRPDIAADLPRLVAHFDEPFGDKSLVPTYYVARMARRHVKVALSGDGGDEVFGGYVSYTSTLAKRAAAERRPAVVNALVATAARLYPRRFPQSWRVRKRAFSMDRRFVAGQMIFDPDARRALYGPALAPLLDGDPLRDRPAPPAGDLVTSMQLVDLEHYLPDDILTKVDRMTMLASLESRAPFLDHRLVELMMGLPAELKIGGGTTKRLLRELGRELLPAEVLARPKRGFALPVQAWLSRDLAAMVRDVVGGRALRETGWFRARELERLLAAGRSGALSQQLWSLLCLGLWLEGRRS